MVKHGLPGATSGNKLIDPSIVAFHRKVTRIMTEERYTRWHAFTCARCGDKTAYPAISAIIAYRLSIIENIRCVQYNDIYTLTMNDTIFLSSNFLSLLIREKLKKKKYRRILNISFFFFFSISVDSCNFDKNRISFSKSKQICLNCRAN